MSLKSGSVLMYLLVMVTIGLALSNQVLAAPGDLNWSTKTSLPTPQQGIALAAGANGKLYSIGGSANGSRDVVEYNPQTNTWANRARVPIFRLFSAAATGTDGKIYVIGGLGTNTVQAYDPNSDTWTNRASLPHNVYYLGAVTASNGKIYAVGGICGDCSIPGSTYEYDVTANTWTEKSPMPIPTYGHGLAATSDGKIYAISGEGGDSMRRVVQEYDTNTDTWSRKADLLSSRYLLGAATLSNGKIYAVGGRTTLPPDGTPVEYSTVESYDPATDTWFSESPMQSVRASLGVVNLEGVLYAVGGFDCHFTSDCSDLNVVEAAGIETANQAPSVDAGGPYIVNEGSSVSVSATGSDLENGNLTYAWDLDNNGSFETAGQSVSFSATALDGPSSHAIVVQVTDDGGLTATDGATVQISNVAPVVGTITVTPSGNIPLNTSATISAPFSDAGTFDTHTATWNWGDSSTDPGTVTESSGSGSVSGTHTYTNRGTYTVTLTVSDGQGGSHQASTSVTVVKQLTSLDPAQVWVGIKNSDAVGIKFDLRAEVYKDGVLVTSGQLDSVPGGSSGFGNANLNTIPFANFSPIDFPAGSSLSVKVSARNACVGSGKNSGTARLWFNDSAANSQFGATITPDTNDYYLWDAFALGTSAGPGPKKSIDVAAGAKCSPFKSFGEWSVTP